MLIWTNFNSFAITYLIQVVSKVSLSNRGCGYFFANIKLPGTSFQVAILVEFFNEFISFGICQKHASFH